jgi:nucleotide-binding universal stress UspA family protein
MRRVLVAVSGVLLSQFLDRVLRQLDWTEAELYLLHVVDTRPLREFRFAAGHLATRSDQAAERVRQMGALSAETGARMLEEAETQVRARLPHGPGVWRLQRTGIPEREIVAAAYEIEAGLIVLGAAEDPAGPPEGPPPRGPSPPKPPAPPWGEPAFSRRNLSPTVRFVVDHAPCDVLLLYAGRRGG